VGDEGDARTDPCAHQQQPVGWRWWYDRARMPRTAAGAAAPGGDDIGGTLSGSAGSKRKAGAPSPSPTPAPPSTGPSGAEFVTVWLRHRLAVPEVAPLPRGAKPGTVQPPPKLFTVQGDSVVVPLRHPATGALVTNRQFLALLWTRVARLVRRGVRGGYAADSTPYAVGFVSLGGVGGDGQAGALGYGERG
jgi:hypothetical protein